MSIREEFWRETLSELSASGLSMRQFCRERNLKYQSHILLPPRPRVRPTQQLVEARSGSCAYSDEHSLNL